MKHCKTCRHSKKKDKLFCKEKLMNVSVNANWCDSYKESLIQKIKKIWKIALTVMKN